MSKALEKSLRDAVKEDKLTVGSKQVLGSIGDSKLVVVSKSVAGEQLDRIESGAKEKSVPVVRFDGTSVALGRLCGLQFRISTASFSSLGDASIKSILKDVTGGAK